jgi:hypothetical protein
VRACLIKAVKWAGVCIEEPMMARLFRYRRHRSKLDDRAGNRASDHPSAAFDEGRQQRCDQLATHDVDTSWGKLGHGG